MSLSTNLLRPIGFAALVCLLSLFVLPGRADPIAPAAAERLLAVPGGNGQLSEVDDQINAEQTLIGWNAYQPVFNGLKYRQASWQQTIVTEGGARFFTPEMVMHSFLFMIDPPPEGVEGRRIGADRIREFCNSNMARGRHVDSAHRRLAGLCALADCTLVSADQWRALTRAAGLGAARSRIVGDDRDQNIAQDAAFLLRVSSICGEGAAARNFAASLAPFYRFIADLRERCAREVCGTPSETIILRALAVDAHLLLAVGKSRFLPADLAVMAARNWLGARSVLPPPDAATDPGIQEYCDRAQVPPQQCRVRFPHSYFLEGHYMLWIARPLATVGTATSPCIAISILRVRHWQEVHYRFASPDPLARGLGFAPRCFTPRSQ